MPKFARFGLVAFLAVGISIGTSLCARAAEPGQTVPIAKQEAAAKTKSADKASGPTTTATVKTSTPTTTATVKASTPTKTAAVKTSTPTKTAAAKTSTPKATAKPQSQLTKTDTKQTPAEVLNNGKPGEKTAETAATGEKNKTRVAVQTGHASVPNAKRVHTRSESRSDGLVPPPPPETPTILAMPGMMESVPYELSPASLSAKRKDLVVRLATAKKVLDDKNRRLAEAKTKATQFQSLFTEGVISKRELDNSQTEAESALNDVNDANAKVTSVQNMITQIDDRLAPKSAKKKKTAPTKTTSVKNKPSKASAPGANDEKQATKTDTTKTVTTKGDAVKTDASRKTTPASSAVSGSVSGSPITGGSSSATTPSKSSPAKAKNSSDAVDSIPYIEAGDTSTGAADKTSKPTAVNAH